MAAIEIVEVKSSVISARVVGLDAAYNQATRMAVWFLDGVEDGDVYLKNQITEGGDYNFTGLEPETEYEIYCEIWYDVDGTGNYQSVELDPVTVTTLEGSAGYELIYTDLDEAYGTLDVTKDPIFEVNGYLRKTKLYCVKCTFSEDCTIAFFSNSGNTDMDMIGYYTTTPDWDEIDGEPDYMRDEYGDMAEDDGGQKYSSAATDLDFGASFDVEAGRTYYLWWRLYDDSVAGSFTIYVKRYSGGGSSGIPLWSWSTSNGDASDKQTALAYQALTGHGPITDFSHLVWNDLCNKIAEVQDYAIGNYWATDGAGGLTLSETRMDADDRTLTADRFNSMKYNIGRNYSTGIADVEPGDPVLGSYFIKITDKLNDWIRSL